ncbi:ribosome-binding protein aMBF1 (putative translation factor) [Oxalobacteraceae bacterium GrIS 2.11]
MQNLRIGQNHPKAVLSDREVELLRHLREVEGWSYNKLAKHFEILKAQVQKICTYRRR